jgi:hypothetical protein
VLLKAEVAELLLPSVIVNLAGRKDMDVDLHKIISLQVVFLSYLVVFCFFFLECASFCVHYVLIKYKGKISCSVRSIMLYKSHAL